MERIPHGSIQLPPIQISVAVHRQQLEATGDQSVKQRRITKIIQACQVHRAPPLQLLRRPPLHQHSGRQIIIPPLTTPIRGAQDSTINLYSYMDPKIKARARPC